MCLLERFIDRKDLDVGLPAAGLLPNSPQQSRMSQTQARSQELYPDLPHVLLRAQVLGPPSNTFLGALAGRWIRGGAAESWPRSYGMLVLHVVA